MLIAPVLFLLIISPVFAAIEGVKTADEHYLMGNALYSFGQPGNATEEYRMAVQLNPDYPEAWNNLGIALTRLERHEEALSALENATRTNPSDPEAWYNKGYSLGKLGRYKEEADAYQEAVRIRPNMTRAWRNIGVGAFEQGNLSLASAAFEKVTQYDPSSDSGWYYLGIIYEMAGNLTGAQVALKEAIALNPNLTMAKDRLGGVERNMSVGINQTGASLPADKKRTPLPFGVIVIALICATIISREWK